VKRLGRDEPVWVAIHKCMEAALGISLYVFSSTKSENKRVEQVLPRRRLGVGRVYTMYTYVSKCKNDKIKERK
jgi:hypothetical protein